MKRVLLNIIKILDTKEEKSGASVERNDTIKREKKKINIILAILGSAAIEWLKGRLIIWRKVQRNPRFDFS